MAGKELIEVDLPLEAIKKACARESRSATVSPASIRPATAAVETPALITTGRPNAMVGSMAMGRSGETASKPMKG